ASLRTSRDGVVLPDAPPQMRELVRRGPLALPELIKHLDDKRLTKLDVGGSPPGSPGVFVYKVFGHAYSPRVRESQPPLRDAQPPEPPWTEKTFTTTYTLRGWGCLLRAYRPDCQPCFAGRAKRTEWNFASELTHCGSGPY